MSPTAVPASHGDIHLAITEVTQDISSDPHNASLYFQRAQFYQVDRDFENAKKDYLKARALDPKMVMTDYGLANLHLEHGQIEQALGHIEVFLSVLPDHANGRFTRSMILSAMQREEDALADIETGIQELVEPRPEHFLLAARTTLLIDSTKVSEAIEWLEKGKQVFGRNIVLAEKYIEFAIQTASYSSALGKVDEVLTYFPRAEKWQFKKGTIYEMMGDHQNALSQYLKCLDSINSLPPRHKNTRAILGLQAAALAKRDALESR